jgi:putative Na+/H+ antiporter
MRDIDPLNLAATVIFFIAILHTFLAARVTSLARHVQYRHDERRRVSGLGPTPSVLAEGLHFIGEVELIFGLWVVPLLIVYVVNKGWEEAKHYVNDTVNYTEALFVVVIMVLASTRPIVTLAETALRRIAMIGRGTPGAWWITILIVGPVLGSFITEPAAMTICALLLSRQFFDLEPDARLKYSTLGLLFVNVSVGGTLTHFAAPPVLMVARQWNWDTGFMLSHFGWRAALAVVLSTACYYLVFRRQFVALALRPAVPDIELPADEARDAQIISLIPPWITAVHVAFMAWTVLNAHYPALLIGGFLFFLGFSRVTAAYQGLLDLKAPMLVGFFLAGLVIHGGLQGWWIAPLLSRLSEVPLFVGSAVLTMFNDNALITYLGTLVPSLDEPLRIALVEGAVTGGGLTVIANAPNPAGQALLGKFFGGTVQPLRLFLGALFPTLVVAAIFRLI